MWLFVPSKMSPICEASVYAPVSEDWTSAFISRSPDIAQVVLSSETLSPHPFSWHGWRTRPWLRHLSGTICAPSTAARGADVFISSLPIIPANRLRSRGTAAARRTRAISGQKSHGLSTRSSRRGYSSKTSLGICPSVSTSSVETFKKWAIELRRASSARQKSVLRTVEKGCSFWPTPTVAASGNRACIQPREGLMMFRPDLNQTGKQLGLKETARAWTLLWYLAKALRAPMDGAAFSLPCRIGLTSGEPYLKGGLQLSPAFTDLMMGWPSGWTDPLRPGTEWSHWLRQSRGALSRLSC